MMDNDKSENKGKKRKRKTILRNAKKYSKRGYYGRGSDINPDLYDYFVHVLELIKKGFDSEEDQDVFVENVFEQTKNQELNICGNQLGCRIIEILLPYANEEILEHFFDVCGKDLRPILNDRFASHVLDMLVKLSMFHSIKHSNDGFKKICMKFLTKISKFLLNNLEEFIDDMYANQLIRQCILNLAGINEPKKGQESFMLKSKIIFEEITKDELLDEYKEICLEYINRLMIWPQFDQFPYDILTSGLLQVILVCLKKLDKKLLKKFCAKLIESFRGSNETTFPVFKSEPALHLLEKMIEISKEKLYTKILNIFFLQKLAKLVKSKPTCFSVQKLVIFCKTKENFELIFDELVEEFENILTNNSIVIVNLAQACLRLSTQQNHFLNCLFKALKLDLKNVNALQTIFSFGNKLHGSLIIQTILEFNKPIKLVECLLNTETGQLVDILNDRNGSYIMDAFMKSKFIGVKSRDKLIYKLKGHYSQLAGEKFGSRCLDAIWEVTSLKEKLIIMHELCEKDSAWSNSVSGRVMANKLKLSLFKMKKDEWIQAINKKEKVQEMFSEIISK